MIIKNHKAEREAKKAAREAQKAAEKAKMAAEREAKKVGEPYARSESHPRHQAGVLLSLPQLGLFHPQPGV